MFVDLPFIDHLPFLVFAIAPRLQSHPFVDGADAIQSLGVAGPKAGVGTKLGILASTLELGFNSCFLELERFFGAFDVEQFPVPLCRLLRQTDLSLDLRARDWVVRRHGAQWRSCRTTAPEHPRMSLCRVSVSVTTWGRELAGFNEHESLATIRNG